MSATSTARPNRRMRRTSPNLDWQTRAECVHADPDLFAAAENDPHAVLAAKRVCHACPVVDECLAHAMAYGEEGIWGATTASERGMLKRGCKLKAIGPRRFCVTCGGAVTGRGRTLYCSLACSRKRTCNDCGTSFMTSGEHRPRFCAHCRRVRKAQAARAS